MILTTNFFNNDDKLMHYSCLMSSDAGGGYLSLLNVNAKHTSRTAAPQGSKKNENIKYYNIMFCDTVIIFSKIFYQF